VPLKIKIKRSNRLNLPYADLHIHSLYSDGTMTPKEILDEAVKNGVGLLAVADHDILKGSSELKALSLHSPVKCIPAVEIDAYDHGQNVHILAYNPDFSNAEFIRFVAETRQKLDQISKRLIERMQPTIPEVSLEDFNRFDYPPSGGGWKALHYLLSKGLTQTLMEGVKFYPEFGCTYEESGYSAVSEVCRVIHKAGGKAVLAHPGLYRFEEPLKMILEQFRVDGIDGLECYYPKHSEEMTAQCLAFCNQHHLMITAGSDCHGTFTGAPIGFTKTPISALFLSDLAKNA